MNSILGKLGGRKFLVAVLGAVSIAFSSYFGIDENSVKLIGGVVMAYVFGQGIADGFSGGATSTVAQNNLPPATSVDDK